MQVILEAVGGFMRFFFTELIWSGIGELFVNIGERFSRNKQKNRDESEVK